jgi:hypothetical protein
MKQGITYKQQIEGVEGALPSRLAPVCGAMLSGAVTALLFGSNALLNWVNNLPIGPVSDNLLAAAQDWQNGMAAAGIAKVSAALANGLTAFQALHW